jgi:hypothetical protein
MSFERDRYPTCQTYAIRFSIVVTSSKLGLKFHIGVGINEDR